MLVKRNKRPLVYDKISWHLDEGENKKKVLDHFKFMSEWFITNNLLNKDGLEILQKGIDDSISFHSGIFTERGNKFMRRYYNDFISASPKDKLKLDSTLKLIH
jgi:hypothetical protein